MREELTRVEGWLVVELERGYGSPLHYAFLSGGLTPGQAARF